jgi:protein-S-isoprenylcysteine O-methyltransferase Ste14
MHVSTGCHPGRSEEGTAAMGIFEGAYFAWVIVASAVRVVYTRRYRQTRVARDHRRGLDALLSGLPGLGMFVLPIIYVLTDWLDFANYRLPLWAGWLGVVLFGVAVWLLWRSHADLERSWSPRLEIMEDHSLITHGVFRYIRHPMYAAHWLWGVAQVLLLQNWIAGFSMLVCMVPMYLYRARVEEEMMLEEFGDEYRQYMARTGGILPRFW